MTDTPEKTVRKNIPVSDADPRPGCLMFIVGGVVILTLVTWAIFAFFKQKEEIRKFSDLAPAKLEQPAYDPQAAQSAAAKLTAADAAKDKDGTVTLTGPECIALLATHPLGQALKDQVVLTSVDTAFHFDCAIPLTKLGVYLNAKITGEPFIDSAEGLSVNSTKLEVPGKTVPEQFAEGYHVQKFFSQLILAGAHKDRAVAGFLRRVSSAKLVNGTLELAYKAEPTGK